ncbi:MAG TPA: PqqD family protein [Candidatus Omnitrophica bacterium]|nr:PqqD family protein [Candidatus Omnitrophota bacterium]
MSKIYKRNPDFVYRDIAGESVLVPIRNKAGDMENIYVLNEVASRAWGLFDGKNSAAKVLDVIAREFDVEIDKARADLKDFISQCLLLGFIS